MITNITTKEFINQLASDAPTPGGGGASALAGALGAALGNMVCRLTLRSKKYQDVWPEIEVLSGRATALSEKLALLVERDAEAFKPLAAAYRIPKDQPGRAEVMESALYEACLPPLEIMRVCVECIALHRELAVKGTRMAVSDVGVGVALCAAALQGASLNVYINTGSMADRERAGELERQAAELLDGVYDADDIFAEVAEECTDFLKGRRWHRR